MLGSGKMGSSLTDQAEFSRNPNFSRVRQQSLINISWGRFRKMFVPRWDLLASGLGWWIAEPGRAAQHPDPGSDQLPSDWQALPWFVETQLLFEFARLPTSLLSAVTFGGQGRGPPATTLPEPDCQWCQTHTMAQCCCCCCCCCCCWWCCCCARRQQCPIGLASCCWHVHWLEFVETQFLAQFSKVRTGIIGKEEPGQHTHLPSNDTYEHTLDFLSETFIFDFVASYRVNEI